MKVTGLEGDYCPTCAAILEGHIKDKQKLIVMCGSVCHATLQQTGDYDKLHTAKDAPKEEKKDKNKRAESRDDGESEQHAAEKAGYVPGYK
jgi:Zn-finger nucleic acid-binding protein